MIIETKVLKNALTDLKKFLGNKVGPVNFHTSDKELILTQASSLASAKVVIPYSKMQKPPKKGILTAADSDWFHFSIQKSSALNIELSLTESTISIKFGKISTQSTAMQFEGLTEELPEMRKIPQELIKFVREHSRLLRMRPYFSNRPLAATIGTIEKFPFFMVNDQYHGFIVVGDTALKKDIEKFSMDAASASAIAFDPNMVEEQDRLQLSVTEGRVYIKYPTVTYEVPAFEPSAVPSIQEIEELLRLAAEEKSNNTHCAVINAEALSEALSLFRRSDETQSFTILQDKENLLFEYSSSTVDSKSEVHTSSLKWKKQIGVDPAMFSETIGVLYDYIKNEKNNKKNKPKPIKLSVVKDTNILIARFTKSQVIKLGFVITSE